MTFFVTHDVSHYGDVIKRWCKHLCQKTWSLKRNKARATTSYLEEQQVQVLPHPAYSPDLAPCDFWLFPTIKSRLAGRKFLRVQDLKSSEFRAARYTCIGVPQRLSAVAREAAMLCGEQRRVLRIMLKVSTPWVLYFLRYDTTCRTYWMTLVSQSITNAG